MSLQENKFYVYALVDPFNDVVFYVGKGKGMRCYSHLRGRANYNENKIKTINNIRMLGKEPVVHFVAKDLSNEEAKDLEKYVIGRIEGCSYLTNSITYPPDATGRRLSSDHKKRLSAINKGKILSPEHKRKISRALKKPIPEQTLLAPSSHYDKNQGGRNPNAIPVIVNGVQYSCKKEAATCYGVTPEFFRKNFQFTVVNK